MSSGQFDWRMALIVVGLLVWVMFNPGSDEDDD